MSHLKLTLVTPLKKVYEGVEVSEIKVPAEKGELTIYPDHSPLVTTLDTGVLSYKLKGSSEFSKAVVTWGYVEVIDGKVHLLAETAETADRINLEQAHKNLTEAEKALASNTLDPEQIAKMQHQLKLAEAQITVAG